MGTDSSAEELCPACLLREALSLEDGPPSSSADVAPINLEPGTLLGPFRIGRLIGKGGMATVYEALEGHPLERTVALKVLPPQFLHDDMFARRFVQEARVVARLEHPSIVPIYASGIDGGIPWISMRLLTGGSLGTLLQDGALSVAQTMRILGDLADGLDFAHVRGVIHRDIKPTNVLMDDSGRAYICDFGLARLVMGIEQWTRSGVMLGTPHYMAPEQAIRGKVDERCDTYSLGVVAYEMLTGSPPFDGDTPIAVLMQHANAPVPPVPPDRCPESMSLAIQQALAKNPADRWPSARAFVHALESGAAGHTPSSRWTRFAAAAAVTLVAAGAGAYWLALDTPAAQRIAVAPQPESAIPVPVAHTGPSTPERSVPNSKAAPRRNAVADALDPREELTDLPSKDAEAGAANAPGPEALRDRSLETDTPRDSERNDSPTPKSDFAAQPAVSAPVRGAAVAPVMTEPKLVHSVEVKVPDNLQAQRIRGKVVVRGTVGADGRVSNVEIVQGLDPRLDRLVRTTFLQFRYEPALREGVAVSAPHEHTFLINMKKE